MKTPSRPLPFLTLVIAATLALFGCGNDTNQPAPLPETVELTPSPTTSAPGEPTRGVVNTGGLNIEFEVLRAKLPENTPQSIQAFRRDYKRIAVRFRYNNTLGSLENIVRYTGNKFQGTTLRLNEISYQSKNNIEIVDYPEADEGTDLSPWLFRYELKIGGKTTAIVIREAKDFVVNGLVDLRRMNGLTSTVELRALVITENSQLIAGGVNLTLQLQRLIAADNAQIANLTTQEALTAPPPFHPGIDGGNLSIITQKASGALSIDMRGGRGADGLPGENIPITKYPAKAPAGAPGQGKVVGAHPPKCHGGRFDRDCTDSNPGHEVCTVQPQNGARGLQGFPGGDGEKGQRGGASGHLSLAIKEPSNNFYYSIRMLPGLGGDAGLGGTGGPGGEGGSPGANPGFGCSNAAPGPTGEQGVMGEMGTPGLPGALNNLCLQKNNAEATCIQTAHAEGQL